MVSTNMYNIYFTSFKVFTTEAQTKATRICRKKSLLNGNWLHLHRVSMKAFLCTGSLYRTLLEKRDKTLTSPLPHLFFFIIFTCGRDRCTN